MTAKSTKKKTAKKQAKRGAGTGVYGREIVGGPPQMPSVVPFPDALKEFDAALEKVKGLRGIILPNLTDEATANRARRLSDAASALQNAAWALRESAYHEADK